MYHHLTNGQRCQIYALKKRKFSLRSIARDLTVDPSTISREINRNSGCRGYRLSQAQLLTDIKKHSSTSHPHKMTTNVLTYIQDGLALQWSPEQIGGRLLLDKGIRLSQERIYQHIWQDKKAGGLLFKNLRQRGKKYNKRASKTAGRGLIPGRIDICCHPEVVDLKSLIGDWEADSVLGQQLGGGVIVTLCERKSLLVKIGRVRRRTSDLTQSVIIRLLNPLSRWVHTITYDNGKEFAGPCKSG
ncbi:MAG: IS30 family transposase [Alphaproteobacteria bacterium]|nr:IS30 family transposase [Alphaproteobacteria bacterium]